MKPALLQHFYKIFDIYLPQNICEIGTHNGQSAFQFVDYLWPKVHRLHYTGYDLFEDADAELTKVEHNGKGPGSYQSAFRGLEKRKVKYGKRFDFELIRGNTKQTLTEPKVFDFVYIDGGHSYDTVIHDYSMVKDSTVIVFDDYQIKEVSVAVEEIKNNLSSNCEIVELAIPERPKRKQIALLNWNESNHNQVALLS
jgi:predicted O-methyltransferase YrrM